MEVEPVDVDDGAALVEQAKDHGLAVRRREAHGPQVDAPTVDDDAGTPVLGRPPVGDVHLAEDLDAAHDPALQRTGHSHEVTQHAVDAEADAQLATRRLDVEVGRAVMDGPGDDLVDEADDRSLVGVRGRDDGGVARLGRGQVGVLLGLAGWRR